MTIELVVPEMGESITEVQIGEWFKSEGDYIDIDESVCEIESEKATVELPSPVSGILTKIVKKTGEDASVGDVIGHMEEAAKAPAELTAAAAVGEAQEPAGAAPSTGTIAPPQDGGGDGQRVMPAAKRELAERGLAAEEVAATGPGGRLLKEDVLAHVAAITKKTPPSIAPTTGPGEEEVVRMSPMRRTIAKRLVEAQQNAALLTTFNEADMTEVMSLRKDYKDTYLEKYGTKLGFMSFFIKASVEALKLVPEVNAEVRGDTVVYRNYYDIGIAVGGGKGLVVPILRRAERMSFAEIELAITDFGKRAQKNRISMEELQGGTFTISNGGVYGSLLSTPIINPPQSGILGMHTIQDRPMALNGEVVIRPMMYIALTYDHRVVDGQGAVTFLKRIKECIEEPSRILLEI